MTWEISVASVLNTKSWYHWSEHSQFFLDKSVKDSFSDGNETKIQKTTINQLMYLFFNSEKCDILKRKALFLYCLWQSCSGNCWNVQKNLQWYPASLILLLIFRMYFFPNLSNAWANKQLPFYSFLPALYSNNTKTSLTFWQEHMYHSVRS